MNAPFQRGIIHRVAKSAFALALTATMLASSIPLAPAETVTPKIIQYFLPTGQTLYIKEDHSQPIVTIDTWVKTGSVNETKQINGVSHFLEHLLFKGTQQYPAGKIDRILESRGAEFNAATSDDFTHYYITTATPYFEEALRLHSDMMLNATIPDNELVHERKVVQEEINRALDNPDRKLYTTLSQLMYGSHGYAMDTLGPKENIANIPRDNILEYYHYWYQPQNFNTVIVGDVNPKEAQKLVEQYFPAPPYQSPKNYKAPKNGNPAALTGPQVRTLTDPNVSQAYLALGFLGPALENEQDVYALDIAMLALGNGKSSRLYKALRERKPLVNSISAGNYTQKYSGLVVVSAEAKPENLKTVKQEIIDQLQTLKAEGITESELQKAKTQYLKDFIFENETTNGVASSLGYNVTIGSLEDYTNHVANVEKVTLSNVTEAVNRYLDFNKATFVEMLPEKSLPVKEEEAANLNLLKTAAGQMPKAKPDSPVAAETKDSRPQSFDVSDVQKQVLPNGVTLLMKPAKGSSTVAVKIFVKGGQGVEKIPGTASLASELLMQGTSSRTAEAISQELESKGMNLSASATEDYIEITGTAIAEDFGELFTVLRDVINNPAFAENEIAKEKIQMAQAIAASRDNPSTVTFENLSLAMYPNHPYGNVGKRVEANLDKITRAELVNYFETWFKPKNMVVSVAGQFDPATVKSYFNSAFAANTQETSATTPEKPVAQAPAPSLIPPVPAMPKSQTVEEKRPQLAAVWLAQGWIVPPIENQKDYAALKVLNSMLGTGMSSRLFVNLREKQGLAYVVGSFYPTRERDSRFVIYIGTDPVNTERVKKGFAEQVRLLQTTTVPVAELEEAKSKLIGSYALAHDTNTNKAYYLGLFETLGVGYAYDATYPEQVRQVTPEDIRRVAAKYFSGPSVTSLIRPATMPAAKKK